MGHRPVDLISTPVAHRLEQVREIAGAINATSDLGAILDQIVFSTCHHSSWWTGGIMAINRANGYSELVTRYTPASAILATLPTRWSLDTSPSRIALERRQPIIIPDAQKTTEYPGYRGDAIARDYHTVVVLSLNVSDAEGRDLVLAVHSKEKIDVGKEELDFLSTISHLAAIAVNKAKLVSAERAYGVRLRGVLSVSSTLFERVLEDGRMDAIVPLIEATLLHSIAVADFTADRLYAGRTPGFHLTDRQWAEFLQGENAVILRNLIRSASPSDFRTIYEVEMEGFRAAQIRVEPIRIDDETVGGLVIFPTEQGMTDFDILVAQNAKFALSTLLIRSHVASRQLFAQVSDLLERAVEGTAANEPTFRARAAQLGWSFAEEAQLLLVEVFGQNERVGLEPIKSIERDLKRIHPEVLVGVVRQKIIVSIPKDDYTERLKRTLLSLIEATMKWETSSQPVIIEGPVISDISALSKAFHSCLRTLTLARMFGRKGIIQDADFGSYGLLISTLDDNAIQGFVAQTVGAIKAYDVKHGTELMKTTSIFIDQNCRFQKAAKTLDIHVSTLRYRVERLQSVFGMDLGDAETRFALALAIRLDGIKRGQ